VGERIVIFVREKVKNTFIKSVSRKDAKLRKGGKRIKESLRLCAFSASLREISST
jgi:hypothetical protein